MMMPVPIKIILVSLMVLIGLLGSFGSFVIWQSANNDSKKEQDAEERLLMFTERGISLFFAVLSMVVFVFVLVMVFWL